MNLPQFDFRRPIADRRLSKRDFVLGSGIAVAMLVAWMLGSSGASLVATFVPGILAAWVLFAMLYFRRMTLPAPERFLSLYYPALGWQCIHFAEEFITGFYERFPALYGGAAYSVNAFVAFNMASYFVFALCPVLVYAKALRFLLMPVLFFVVYGMMGNAIAHAWWCLYAGEYFPGFYTSLPYWLLGPWCLRLFLQSWKATAVFIALFAAALLMLLTVFISR